jgi:hypothetical protein
MAEGRFQIKFLHKGSLVGETDSSTFQGVRGKLLDLQRSNFDFLKKGGDINVIDTKENTEWHVDQKWRLVEM